MLFFSDFLFTQVRIKEKVVINPNNQSANFSNQSTGIESVGPTKVTARIEYWACSGNVTLSVASSPCSSYNNIPPVTGGDRNGRNDKPTVVELTFDAYDQGTYSFKANSSLICLHPACSPGSLHCRYSAFVRVNGITFSSTGGYNIENPNMPLYIKDLSDVCGDIQPQTLDFNNIEVYQNGQLYNGTEDITGNNCTSIIRLCPTSIPVDEYDLGATGGSFTIPSFSNPSVLKPSYSNISGCIEGTTGKKHLKVEGLKLPLICDICSDPLNRLMILEMLQTSCYY